MKKVIILLFFALVLSGCSMKECVETEVVEVFVKEDCRIVKDYWTGFPESICIPEHMAKKEVCTKYEEKEVKLFGKE